HNGIRYFVTGGGGAPLYPRRPHPNPIDLDAVKKFERVLHYLRVTVTGDRVEVTAIRSDGTLIEATSWTEGPAPAEPMTAKPIVAAAGASQLAAAPPPPPPTRPVHLVWVVIGGCVLVGGVAFALWRTLR